MRSCSASGAAAGSPLPPIAAHVARLNWYLPRYWPLGEIAVGSPPDSHCAIACSRALGAVVWAALAVLVATGAGGVTVTPRAAIVAGPATPSAVRPWARWKRLMAARVRG